MSNRTSYIWCKKRKRLITKATAMRDAAKQSRLIVIKDIDPYVSIATGDVVSGRAAKREDLKRSGCVEYEPSMKVHAAKSREYEHGRLLNRMTERMAAAYRD